MGIETRNTRNTLSTRNTVDDLVNVFSLRMIFVTLLVVASLTFSLSSRKLEKSRDEPTQAEINWLIGLSKALKPIAKSAGIGARRATDATSLKLSGLGDQKIDLLANGVILTKQEAKYAKKRWKAG